jgi:hypothetical protein
VFLLVFDFLYAPLQGFSSNLWKLLCLLVCLWFSLQVESLIHDAKSKVCHLFYSTSLILHFILPDIYMASWSLEVYMTKLRVEYTNLFTPSIWDPLIDHYCLLVVQLMRPFKMFNPCKREILGFFNVFVMIFFFYS